MREIKFRGQKIDTKEWIYGYYHLLTRSNTHCIDVPMADFDNSTLWHVVPETIGQCTDLTDKNGKEIYEGDVMRDTDTGHVKTVEYHAPRFVLVDKDRFFDYSHWDEYEVIGNIYENLELLESGQ